jgi:putative addiction module component (TIGR02574 family)
MASTSLQHALDLALELSIKERAELAQGVLASLDGEPDPDCGEAWESEIVERMEKLAAGQTKLVASEDVLRRIDERLRR